MWIQCLIERNRFTAYNLYPQCRARGARRVPDPKNSTADRKYYKEPASEAHSLQAGVHHESKVLELTCRSDLPPSSAWHRRL